MDSNIHFPSQRLPFRKKNKEWRKQHLDWADQKTFSAYSPVRSSIRHKKINYDLIDGKLHMDDLEYTINPEGVKDKGMPDKIQHYPIMNPKINVLIGEELDRVFDYRVIVTNPLAISEKETAKKEALLQQMQQQVMNESLSEEEYQQNVGKIADYFSYEWQDMREIKANQLLNHYSKEYNMPLMFNNGFKDGLIVGEEIYQCDIRGGEPIIEKVNPREITAFRSGYSNRLEDADVILITQYWSPGKVRDAFYDVLSEKDRKYLEEGNTDFSQGGSNDDYDERRAFVDKDMVDDFITNAGFYFDPFNEAGLHNSLAPFDENGNVRVIRMYWKSERKIKKVKSFDTETGEEVWEFYPEQHVIDKDKGEEEIVYYINQAWEGTKIGKDIYVNMRPRVVQYNRLSNPSRCHFGIVGSIYNINNGKPFSLVDMMKPFSYLYDVVHDRLNRVMARNWGKIIQLDLAKVPEGWDMQKWLYFAKHNNLAVVDSFKAGNKGPATGKLAGAMNNASSGVIDAELGNIVQQYLTVLGYIKEEMSDVAGISRQREGQIANRETVGGVERATLQSSHITEHLFAIHDDVKKRALECFLETAKIALKGNSKKFQYILSDGSIKTLEIDGDEFAEADYGLVVDNSNGTQKLNQQIETLAQAALQNQALTFSSIMKLYSATSLIEKQRMIEREEQAMLERQQQQQQQQMQLQQQQMQMAAQQAEAQMQQQDALNARDNETKVLVAQINAQAKLETANLANLANEMNDEEEYSQEAKDKLAETIRQFDERLKLDRERLALDKKKVSQDKELKEKQLTIQKQKKNATQK